MAYVWNIAATNETWSEEAERLYKQAQKAAAKLQSL